MKKLKDLQHCDACASRRWCLIYTKGKVTRDCNGYGKEPGVLRRCHEKFIVAIATKCVLI